MARIITIVNQKGGVGKTTTAINLGAYLANLGKFVLLIDIDPQGNASSGLGVDYQHLSAGIYEALTGEKRFAEIILNTNIRGFKIAPATNNLAGANIELVNIEKREYRLAEAMLEIRNDFDYILIDCPPSLGLLTINGIVAGEELLIPVQCEYYALEGLSQLLHTINLVKENLKPGIEIAGAVLTMFDRRNKLSMAVMNEVYEYFPNKIFRSIISRTVRLAEAPSYGQSILEYDPKSKGAKAYERLAREIIEQEQKNKGY